jgi:hypothetical protein
LDRRKHAHLCGLAYRWINLPGLARLMVGTSSDQSEDAMIAETARANGRTVAARNVKDFAQFGIEVFNPFTVAK